MDFNLLDKILDADFALLEQRAVAMKDVTADGDKSFADKHGMHVEETNATRTNS